VGRFVGADADALDEAAQDFRRLGARLGLPQRRVQVLDGGAVELGEIGVHEERGWGIGKLGLEPRLARLQLEQLLLQPWRPQPARNGVVEAIEFGDDRLQLLGLAAQARGHGGSG
jgi:hypothetical protein